MLSSIMVFFRDTQFLYSIIITIWSYLTPIFYPESILPNYMLYILKFNPMYHFIRFIRFIILYGGIPDLKAWAFCLLFALVSFVLGVLVFNKTQEKFILYL